MIKIVHAAYLGNKVIRLQFSDQSWGDCDLQPLIEKPTELVLPLQDDKRLATNQQVFAVRWPSEYQALATNNACELFARRLVIFHSSFWS